MKYLDDSFSVFPGGNENYRNNYDKVFGKSEPETSIKSMSNLPKPRDVQGKKLRPLLPEEELAQAALRGYFCDPIGFNDMDDKLFKKAAFSVLTALAARGLVNNPSKE